MFYLYFSLCSFNATFLFQFHETKDTMPCDVVDECLNPYQNYLNYKHDKINSQSKLILNFINYLNLRFFKEYFKEREKETER